MTKTSIYCYEKNGGGCRNKVSPVNNFICSAGHGGLRQDEAISSIWQKVAPAIDLSGMSLKRKLRLAGDPATSPETLALLAREKSIDIRYAVAGNSSASPETLAQLAGGEDWFIRRAIAGNSSASRGTHIFLAQEGITSYGFIKGKSIDELIKDISLVDQYPDTFGDAYLYRLTYYSTPEDKTHPKRRALIGYVYAKYTESDKADNPNTEWYKDKIKVLFPDDQEMAEMIGG